MLDREQRQRIEAQQNMSGEGSKMVHLMNRGDGARQIPWRRLQEANIRVPCERQKVCVHPWHLVAAITKCRRHRLQPKDVKGTQGARMTKSKVLYIGVGNPSKPRKGMDLVLEAHLDEISVLNDVDLMGLYVSPIDDGVLQSTRWSPLITAFMPDSMSGMRGLSRALRKAMFVLCGSFLPADEFKSKEARHFVEDCLRNEKPKCIIIDHFFSLVNIGLWQIIRAVIIDKTKLIYIAYDATPILLQDIGKLKRGVAARLVYAIQA
jgi:hypothetical protein